MRKIILFILCFLFVNIFSQVKEILPVKWEELTAPDFVKAVEKSDKVCIIPMGIIEKHGPHMPLGTDLIIVRDIVVAAAKTNYVVVFPEFYIGQIDVARPQPGTIAYSPELVWKMLEETCDEIARNGFDKIILVNGHGGNTKLIEYFAQTRMHRDIKYSLYYYTAYEIKYSNDEIKKAAKNIPPAADGHAGANEASEMMVIRPDLIFIDRAKTESGENMDRLKNLTNAQTGINWYAQYPNHYSGNASFANIEYGKIICKVMIEDLIKTIQEVKSDVNVKELQVKFYKDANQPLNIKQK